MTNTGMMAFRVEPNEEESSVPQSQVSGLSVGWFWRPASSGACLGSRLISTEGSIRPRADVGVGGSEAAQGLPTFVCFVP